MRWSDLGALLFKLCVNLLQLTPESVRFNGHPDMISAILEDDTTIEVYTVD